MSEHETPGAGEAGHRFAKGHGTGNDFVLLPDYDGALTLDPAFVRALCDRRAGIGGDGVLRVVRTAALTAPPDEVDVSGAEWFMDYHNADGSLAQMCGNGVRVYVRYLLEEGLLDLGDDPGDDIALATRGGVRSVRVRDGVIVVEMGVPRHLGESVARLEGTDYPGWHVSMGNPHLVCLLDEPLDRLDLTVPPAVPAADFPEGVNVEFVTVAAPDHLVMRVHERGVGETRSCGTGAVAAAAAYARREGCSSGSYTVDVPGGRLRVDIAPEGSHLAGPAVIVARGRLGDTLSGR